MRTPLTDLADDELLAAIARGDAGALAALYDRHARAALALAHRVCGDWTMAEDAVQEAFLSVWRHAASYAPARGSARTWLLRVVHNRAVDRLRRQRGSGTDEPLTEVLAELLADPAPEVWTQVSAGLTRAALAKALAALPAEQREAITLAYFGGLTATESAARTGVPVGTVKGRLRLGLEKMRTSLGREGTEGDGGLA
jgi:RNA polymerase sigma-70 factor (ECF subfamily)